ncbi:MAG: hypothetical protein ACE5GG_03900 [Candidatus Omnitrophota bacterium]
MPDILLANGLDPQVDRDILVKIRITDVEHSGALVATKVSAAFDVKYYQITWNVTDLDSGGYIQSLSVSEVKSGAGSTWAVTDNALNAPVTRNYAYGTYSTTWSGLSSTYGSSQTDRNWVANSDQARSVRLENSANAAVAYNVNIDYVYSKATDTVTFKAWLERKGLLQTNQNAFSASQPATIDIKDGNTTIVSLSSAIQNGGVYVFIWGVSGVSLDKSKVYFARAGITYNSNTYTSGGVFSIQKEEEMDSIRTDVSNVAAQVATVSTQVTGARGDISAVKTDVGNVSTAIGAATDTSSTKTVFGRIAAIRAKTAQVLTATGTQPLSTRIDTVKDTVQDVKDATATILGQVVSTAGTAADIAAVGQTITDMSSQFAIVEAALKKIDISDMNGAISDMEAVYSQLVTMSEKIKKMSSMKLEGLDEMFDISREQSTDVKYLKNKTEELKAAVDLSRKLIENEANKPVTQVWFEFR